jgi:hypothetical protein
LRFAPRFWSLSGAKIYLFFLFCASLLFVGQLFFYHTSDDLTQDVRGLLALSGHQDVVDPTFWTGQGEVLSSGTVDVFVQGETTGMVL